MGVPKKDIGGRTYLKGRECAIGQWVTVDGDFTCLLPWSTHKVEGDRRGLFIRCADGHHYLDGQLGGGVYVGVYPAEQVSA